MAVGFEQTFKMFTSIATLGYNDFFFKCEIVLLSSHITTMCDTTEYTSRVTQDALSERENKASKKTKK